jgi:hypothetical protein
MGQKREAVFAVICGVADPCALTCNAPCVCALILISLEISRRGNYLHDSFSTTPCSVYNQHYIRDKGGGG